jgi:hypothetical protein
MIQINISNIEDKINIGSKLEIKFHISNVDVNKFPKFLADSPNTNKIISKVFDIRGFLGEGSYGSVYKIKLNDQYYAIKFSENEIPNKMLERYKSLCHNDKLRKHVVKIFCCGEIHKNNDKYKYYCIMEYGGKTLKSVTNQINTDELRSILKQLYNIIYQSCKFRILITDLKLGNLTISKDNKVKLIDIYMDCVNYLPCSQCKIVKTYSTIELDKEKRIYEDDSYNYSGIYIPLAICLIELICVNSISYYTHKLCKKFNLELSVKQIIPLLQITCYNFNNDNADSIKQYKYIDRYKKQLESQYKCIKGSEFYEYFLNLLEPKPKFDNFINKKKLSLVINDLLTLDPDQRSLKYLKNKLLNSEHVIVSDSSD